MTLKEYLRHNDETGARFSRRLGVTSAYVSMLVTGQRTNPTIELASKIQRITGGLVPVTEWGYAETDFQPEPAGA